MTFWPRFYLWLIVALAIPIGIFIYEGGYEPNALGWFLGLVALGVIYETINYFVIKKRIKNQ